MTNRHNSVSADSQSVNFIAEVRNPEPYPSCHVCGAEILDSESGVSLKASGWKFSHDSDGGDWNRPSRGGRRTDQPMCKKKIWIKEL